MPERSISGATPVLQAQAKSDGSRMEASSAEGPDQ